MRRDTALKLLSPHGENLIKMMKNVAIPVQGQKKEKKLLHLAILAFLATFIHQDFG